MTADITIEEFKPLAKNTLRGFARVRMPSGVIFHDVSIHNSNGSWWASPASKPMISHAGEVIKDAATGKAKYVPIVSFASKNVRDRFSAGIIEALRSSHPDLMQ